MNYTPAITWFKTTFAEAINDALQGTPYSIDLITAIALQETSYLWMGLINRLTPEEILAICVGDTLDAPNRSAFPKTKAELLAAENGAEMFQVAREALEAIAKFNASYKKVADANPDKFCHGYGIFQYDIQFFQTDAAFFLEKQWTDFSECLERCLRELNNAKRRAYGANKPALTDDEMVYVAIAYNAGRVNTAGSFQQGFKSDDGRFYGENIHTFMGLSKAVQV